MAKPQTRYSDFVTEWEHLLSTLAANAADTPHLEAPRAKLQGLLEQVKGLVVQQDLYDANKQAASKQLQAAVANGKKLATFLRTGLKEHYGNRSQKLVEFGILPFRRRKKSAEEETPPPSTPPPTTGPVVKPAA